MRSALYTGLIVLTASIAGAATPVVIDSYTARNASMAVVDGNPAISFTGGTGSLYYVRATDADGATWPEDSQHIVTGTGASYTSLVVVAGMPAIAYFMSDSLYYLRATDAGGTTWGTPVLVDSGGVVGSYPSMAVVNGNPAVSYFDETNGNLKYVRASTADGSAWGTPSTVDDSPDTVGQCTSLAVVNGNPAISYFNDTDNDLYYLRATDADGLTWGTPALLDGAGSLWPSDTSMTVVNGNPAIAYRDWFSLMYLRAQDANGATWSEPLVVGNSGWRAHASLSVIAGQPAISFYWTSDLGSGNLRFVRALDADGTLWGSTAEVDLLSVTVPRTFLTEVNGLPAIAYTSGDPAKLWYVRANDPDFPVELVSFTIE